MNIEKLTKILGKELAKECENDAPQRDGEFTISEMIIYFQIKPQLK